MDHVEMCETQESEINAIRKKSSLLRDGSYRIFSITKKGKKENDNDERTNQTMDKKSSKIKNRKGLKKFLCLHKTPCESSSPAVSNKLRRSVVSSSRKSSKKEDETIVHNHLLTRTDRLESTGRKQVFVNMHPEIQASVHRRRKRFMIACGTVLIAVTIIITIIIYVMTMNINHQMQISQSSFRNYSR